MADITVKTGQGVTQAIASNLGLSSADCKKVKLSVWQEVVKLVDQNNTKSVNEGKTPTFTGTNDASKIGDRSSWQTNFTVHNGQTMQIDDSIMGKIKQLLTGKAPEVQAAQSAARANAPQAATEAAAAAKPETVSQTTTPTAASSASEANIVADTPLEGSVETGRAANALINKMGQYEDVKVSVISDEISALMNKKDRTPEETQLMHTELYNGMKKLGNSMTKFICAEYGNGSETISPEAFAKFQKAGRDEAASATGITISAQEAQQYAQSDNILFARIDINGDGVIDNKEMSAFYYAMDFDENNRSNGAIDTISAGANAQFLDDPNQNMFDKKMSYTYKTLWGAE